LLRAGGGLGGAAPFFFLLLLLAFFSSFSAFFSSFLSLLFRRSGLPGATPPSPEGGGGLDGAERCGRRELLPSSASGLKAEGPAPEDAGACTPLPAKDELRLRAFSSFFRSFLLSLRDVVCELSVASSYSFARCLTLAARELRFEEEVDDDMFPMLKE
jgi:hypothetical protein